VQLHPQLLRCSGETILNGQKRSYSAPRGARPRLKNCATVERRPCSRSALCRGGAAVVVALFLLTGRFPCWRFLIVKADGLPCGLACESIETKISHDQAADRHRS
jgi:hypothetical protein